VIGLERSKLNILGVVVNRRMAASVTVRERTPSSSLLSTRSAINHSLGRWASPAGIFLLWSSRAKG